MGIADGVRKFWANYSDTVLTGIGVASIVTTAVEAACATPAYMEEMREEEPEGFLEKAKIFAKHYWLPAVNAVLGGASMIGATRINHAERNHRLTFVQFNSPHA